MRYSQSSIIMLTLHVAPNKATSILLIVWEFIIVFFYSEQAVTDHYHTRYPMFNLWQLGQRGAVLVANKRKNIIRHATTSRLPSIQRKVLRRYIVQGNIASTVLRDQKAHFRALNSRNDTLYLHQACQINLRIRRPETRIK